MVDIEDFGIANFRLARKVMKSGKCQCKPKEPCPCKEWIENGICICGVFWDTNRTEFTRGEKKILEALLDDIQRIILESENKR